MRLIEEICMLDHLSGGRFELGVGREAAAMGEEALEVILGGLRGGRLTPLWQGVISPASAAADARRSVNVVSNAPCATVRTLGRALQPRGDSCCSFAAIRALSCSGVRRTMSS